MTEDQLLALRIGGQTVAENLQKAVDSGALLQNEDGTFEFPPSEPTTSPWISSHNAPHLDCRFLNFFLFKCAYGEATVPLGCKDCYKVITIPRTLRQLMALKAIQEGLECTSKCGVEVDRAETQKLYSGYIYCIGLDKARQMHRVVRAAVNDDPKLGPETAVQIKRGCTNYEMKCGPSDKYQFRPELAELEAYLNSRFKHTRSAKGNPIKEKLNTLTKWIQTAYRIGDDSYLDFTGGKALYPKSVTYSPDPKPDSLPPETKLQN